jgi:hypothetical protein
MLGMLSAHIMPICSIVLQPLFDKNKVAELSVKYGGPSTQGKLVLGHSDDEEGSDEGWGLTAGEGDEEAGGNARKKGPGKDKDKKGTKGAAKGRKGGEQLTSHTQTLQCLCR